MDLKLVRNVIIGFVVYSIALLLIGRNLSFLPQFKSQPKKVLVATEDIRKDVLEKFLKGEREAFSIYYKDLKTGEEFGIDENKVQTAASLNKLPIVAYLYNQAARGKQNLEDKIVIQEVDIQDYGTGSIRYQKPGGSYSLKTLTKLSLEQSDNTAAHVLGVRLKTPNVQEYSKRLGLVATDMENNKTSASDMGKILELIYRRKIAGDALTRELLDFLKDTDFEDRLARDIPKNVPIYHKAADGTGFIHDAGIIDDGKNPFILVIMTTDIKSGEKIKETIGKIAKFIYDREN